MALALVLSLIVIAAVAFHFLSPWTFTSLASNWSQIDVTLQITIAITGLVFIAINLFVAYTLIRYRRREGQRAAYEPENKKLEWTLIGLTALGVFALLSPGLFVYSKFIRPPAEAIGVEILARQWAWSFRFPGEDGQFGRAGVEFITPDNPFGLDPEDPAGQDDRLVPSGAVHLPLNVPVQVQLRSQDVLHSFFVPQLRVKMDAVPGIVTRVWFTPTRTGTFEIACAEYCGQGHHVMRGTLTVEPREAFQAWLNSQRSAQALPAGGTTSGDVQVDQGRQLAQSKGCLGCHSVDGSPGVGPSWLGLFGRSETLADGTTVTVDEAYLRESIVDPQAKLVQGYGPLMPPYTGLSEEELKALVAYIKSLAGGP